MTNVLDGVGMAMPLNLKESCPFCGKSDCKVERDKSIDLKKVKSKPKKLGDADVSPPSEQGKHGRARHHMIPVNQCYLMVARVAQMGESVNFDINGKHNGIPLPTVWNPYKVDGTNKNFGKLTEAQKNIIRHKAMKDTGAQWHVGNHHYTVPEKEDSCDDMSDEGELDHVSYDTVVINQLIKLGSKVQRAGLCETGDYSAVKKALEKLCDEIRQKLNSFKDGAEKSYPYYVSRAALDFAGEE